MLKSKVILAAGSVILACLLNSCNQSRPTEPPKTVVPEPQAESKIVRLLAAGQPVFGIFSGEKTPEQATRLVENKEIDFVFYSLERGPFDIPTMQVFMNALVEVSGQAGSREHPLMLRIPPIRDGHEEAERRVHQALNAGVYAVVFPHVESAEDAAIAVRSMRYKDAPATGPAGTRPAGEGQAPQYWRVSSDEYRQRADLWPLNPAGQLLNVLIVEDRVGVENARDIVSTEGVSIVIPGPGDLRRAYEGDAEAIEGAIQTVLSACKEFDVLCGITAGVDDIAERLEQGFRVIIVTQPEAITAGRKAAARPD